MSSKPVTWERVEIAWESAAGRHACRAPLWSHPDAPAHRFLGRPLDGAGEEARPRQAAGLAAEALGEQCLTVPMRQVHGTAIRRVRPGDAAREPDADGLSTDDPALALAVQTADCAPILIADRSRGVVAAVHAGWRGSAAGIVAAALTHLAGEYGSTPGDLEAVIGPSIGGCCYEVGEEVRAAVAAGPHAALARFEPLPGGRLKLDLAALNASALASLGVPPARIQITSACTRCARARLHSFRAEGSGVGRNWSFIAVPRRS